MPGVSFSGVSYIEELREVLGARPLVMVGAGVLAVGSDDELLLILRTDNGLWGLPGGALEPGESLEAAARRELAEETGLRAGELEMITVLSGPELFYRYPNGDEVHNVIAVYTAAQVIGTPRPCNTETSAVRRFPLSDLPENIDPIDRQVIDHYLAHRTQSPAS